MTKNKYLQLQRRTANNEMMVFSGNANQALSKDIVHFLNVPLGKSTIEKFSDGEIMVEILDNVRGKDVFIVQPTCMPTNDNLMELMVMIDAVRRASAKRITLMMPYFGYSRQDRRPRSARVAITAKVVANMLTGVGADRVLTVDLHADQIQGFFNCHVDNVYASPVLLGDIWKHKYQNLVVVSPDVGSVVRARALAKQLDVELAIIDKRRPQANIAKVVNIIGEVKDRVCILIDDMVDTAGTLCAAAEALKDRGATLVVAYCTHPILSGSAVDDITNSVIDKLIVTDTIPLQEKARQCKKIRTLSIAEMLAEAMYRISNEESVSSLYMDGQYL